MLFSRIKQLHKIRGNDIFHGEACERNRTFRQRGRGRTMTFGLRLISNAAEFAARRHNGMTRKGRGNEPYINHLAEVANLLAHATSREDAELVAAGWLHDTIEDTQTTRDELARQFGSRVASGPILTFAPRLGRHVCKCQNRRTTSKIKLLVELLDLTFAWRARGNWGANVKSAPLALWPRLPTI